MCSKVCTKCLKTYPLTHFCKMLLSPDGLSYYCRDCRAIYRKQWTKNNPNYKTNWRSKHPHAHAHHERKRRDLRKMLDNYSAKDESTTRIIFSNMCFNCCSKNNLVIDHHIPLSYGCGLSIFNAVLLCNNCNLQKGSLLPSEFYSQDKLFKLEYILELLAQGV